MSSFSKISNIVLNEINVDSLKSPEENKEQFLLSAMYFSQLVYFKWPVVNKSLKKIPGYIRHKIYDEKGTEAFFVEFENNCWVSFRGTQTELDDYFTILSFWQNDYQNTKTHQGFKKALHRISPDILAEISIANAKGKKIHYTGHSMGASLATLMCIEHRPDTTTVFGCPKTLSGKIYKDFFDGMHYTRIVNKYDFITRIPFTIPFFVSYQHVGKEIKLPKKFRIIKNHFVKEYIKSVLDEYTKKI